MPVRDKRVPASTELFFLPSLVTTSDGLLLHAVPLPGVVLVNPGLESSSPSAVYRYRHFRCQPLENGQETASPVRLEDGFRSIACCFRPYSDRE